MEHMITWFEIPVNNMDRACKFYSEILSCGEIPRNETNGFTMAFLPHQGEGVTGALIKADDRVPGESGPLVYLNAGEDLDGVLTKVAAAGGKIVLGKTQVREDIGFVATIKDSEGNRIAFHSKK